MTHKNSISSHFPHFYKSWDHYSSLFSFVDPIGTSLDESERELIAIMRGHWVDTARNGDLDRLGALYRMKRNLYELDPEFCDRLKTAILSYKGGGTRGAIQMLIRMIFRLSSDFQIQINENPEKRYKKKLKLVSNQEWSMSSRSICDAAPEIVFCVTTPGVKVTEPTITNITTGESITFQGDLASGDNLKISGNRYELNGNEIDASRMKGTFPALPRRRSRWQFSEKIGGNLGAFDRTNFDESVFAIDIVSEITFEWTAYEPATFEVLIPEDLLAKSRLQLSDISEHINMVKACGVKAYVRMV